jgi:hypothetical protein
MPISISFYKPVDYFSGMFNRFAAWWTAGEFCHCELILKTTPQNIMQVVKEIYQGAQRGDYAPEDCQRMIGQIEIAFFDTGFRKLAQSSDTMSLSFSQILGQQMSVRVLTETGHDSWFKIPTNEDDNVNIVHHEDVGKENEMSTLKFAIEELGKDYDTSGALCSWMPFSDVHKSSYDTYFCSEFVVTSLQRIGFMEDLSAKHTTPNSLYTYLQK